MSEIKIEQLEALSYGKRLALAEKVAKQVVKEMSIEDLRVAVRENLENLYLEAVEFLLIDMNNRKIPLS